MESWTFSIVVQTDTTWTWTSNISCQQKRWDRSLDPGSRSREWLWGSVAWTGGLSFPSPKLGKLLPHVLTEVLAVAARWVGRASDLQRCSESRTALFSSSCYSCCNSSLVFPRQHVPLLLIGWWPEPRIRMFSDFLMLPKILPRTARDRKAIFDNFCLSQIWMELHGTKKMCFSNLRGTSFWTSKVCCKQWKCCKEKLQEAFMMEHVRQPK